MKNLSKYYWIFNGIVNFTFGYLIAYFAFKYSLWIFLLTIPYLYHATIADHFKKKLEDL